MGVFNYNSVWLTVLLLSVLVVVHEYGHFLMARLFGVTVYEFSIGFGPLIAKFNRNNIQYSIRWILLGGFCKIAGMDMAIEGEAGEPSPEAEHSFQVLPLWKKISIIAAGPVFNCILAVLLLFSLAAFIGFPSSLQNDAPIIEQASPGTPVFESGIRPGDRIMAINDQPVNKWSEITEIIQKSKGQALQLTILRQKRIIKKSITPMYNEVYKRYLIGIEGVPKLQTVSISEAAGMAITLPWRFTKEIVGLFGLMFRGKVQSDLMGPIGMVSVIEQYLNLPFIYTLSYIFSFAVSISMFLFLFNLLPLPLPLLDGGWIIILLLERLFKREFSLEQKTIAQLIGVTAVIVLGLWIAYGDLLRVFRRFFGG